MPRSYRSKNKGDRFGVFFNDIVDDETAGDWTQVCEECVDTHGFPKEALDDYSWNDTAVCGVGGCENIANHFITFYKGYVKRIDNNKK